jgi:hypothetical protein
MIVIYNIIYKKQRPNTSFFRGCCSNLRWKSHVLTTNYKLYYTLVIIKKIVYTVYVIHNTYNYYSKYFFKALKGRSSYVSHT